MTESRFTRLIRRVDWVLLVLVGTLCAVGLLNLHSAASASYGFALHVSQLVWMLVGFGLVSLMAVFDYRIFERTGYLIFGFVVFLLVLVLLVGTELNGSRRWLNLGFILMQPSELMKVAVVLFTAKYFHDRNYDRPLSLRQLAVPFGIVGASLALILKQPDLGTTLIIFAIFFTMVLFQRVRLSSLAILAFVGVVSIPVVWNFGMHDYQKARVVSFLNLDEDTKGNSWQVRQSIIAFGSGRVWGKGHVEGTQIQKGFVPEHENDFVAANWGEERGFIGMVFLLGLYFALIAWALRISSLARDRFGAHIGVGVAATVFWHVLVNIGMVSGLLPVVGLTLPFLSAGGSSLMTMMMAIGLLLNVSMRRTRI